MATYKSYQKSKIIPRVLAVVVILIVIIGLVTITRALLFSGSTAPSQQTVDTNRQALIDTTAGSAVEMTVRGPIVANEDFRSYKITITPNSRSMATYSGYLDTVINSVNLSNNVPAYTQFVNALDKLGTSKAKIIADDLKDVTGVCATGRVYELSSLKDGKIVQSLWSSTCNGERGSLAVNVDKISDLFKRQIPTSSDLLKGLKLRLY